MILLNALFYGAVYFACAFALATAFYAAGEMNGQNGVDIVVVCYILAACLFSVKEQKKPNDK